MKLKHDKLLASYAFNFNEWDFQLLKLKHENPLSSYAFNVNEGPCSTVPALRAAAAGRPVQVDVALTPD